MTSLIDSQKTKDDTLAGGCLCGEIRYRLTAMPFAAEYCHCTMCQKVAGSAAATWMDFKAEQFTLEKGKIAEYQSSTHVFRGFCAHCGSTISFRDNRYPEYFTVSITSLDHPEKVAPSYHIYTESQLAWFDTTDSCKRHPQGPKSE